MARIRVEFGNLSGGQLFSQVGAAVTLAVTGTATTAGSRPVVPDGASIARLTAIDDNIIAERGTDPTADQAEGILIASGAMEPLGVYPGQKLSFILLA